MIFLEKINYFSNKNPKKIIVYDSQKKWTWNDIISLSNYYIEQIKNNYTKNEISIPILVGRDGAVIAAFIACLKLKICFTPILDKSPKKLIQKICDNLNSNIVLNTTNRKNTINFKKKTKIDNNTKKILNKIYILFTSGSTGEPKGVICDFDNILNTIIWSKRYLSWTKEDIIGNVTKFNFDISLFDFFIAIFFNIPITIIKNPNNIDESIKAIKSTKVSSIFSTPSFFSQFNLNNSLKRINKTSLKRIISGGDFFPPNHILEWKNQNKNISIFNVWGPTETSIVNSMYKIKFNDIPKLKKSEYMPVGFSTPEMNIKIISNNKIVKKSFVEGFVCLEGQSICKGYLGNEKKYRNSFIKINKKLYFNTNDIGYLDDNKKIYIKGRADNTVKLHGYRIDLKEIENLSNSYNNIFLSACYVKDVYTNFKELHMIVQLKNQKKTFDIFNLKKYLRTYLTFYKIPKKIILIEKIPMNSNGKIDRLLIKDKF